MKRRIVVPVWLLLLSLNPICSLAWSVSAGGTTPCHEEFTGWAYQKSAPLLSFRPSALPKDHSWRELSDYLIEIMGIESAALDETTRFMLVSLAAGARAPDTDGHSVFSLANLRKIHSDPSAASQYAHSLRGPDDDYAPGDASAVTGTRKTILVLLDDAATYLAKSPEDQLIRTTVYLDFYGLIDIEVWAPMFYIGYATHVVQDTFSHTIRIEASGFKRIAHVMNYIDAISSKMNESRDGLAHSESFDECREPDLAPVVDSAKLATESFFGAVRDRFEGAALDAPEFFLDEWVTLEQGCEKENNFCNNARWIEIARRAQTESYLSEIVSCSYAESRSPVARGSTIFSLLYEILF